jgi:5'-3' exonuclease
MTIPGFADMGDEPKRVLLADVSHLFWTHWHATEGLEVGESFTRTIETFNRMRSGFDHVAGCCDAPPYFRLNLLPTYKGTRPPKPPMALEQLARVKKRILADGFCLLESKGFEADDLLATASAQLSERGYAVILGTNDKDALQLVNDAKRISVLHPLNGAEFNEQKVIEKFGVHPAMLGDMLALMGDTSDAVPGIPGVGPKTAAKLLLEFGTLEGVLTHGDDMTEKLGAAVKNNAAAARLARTVIALRTDVPINVDDIFAERVPEKLETREYEVEESDEMANEEGMGIENNAAQAEHPPKPDALAKAQPVALAPVQFEHGLEPSTMGAAWQLAKGVFQSRLYPQLATPEAVWAIIIRGREMALGALTALDTIVMIKGKPCLSSHLIIARAKSHPECEYFQLVSSDDKEATYVCKRRGNPEPTRHRYTIEQAELAGLVKNGTPWQTRPAEMLRKTAGAQLARIEFTEALLGAYSVEEMEG